MRGRRRKRRPQVRPTSRRGLARRDLELAGETPARQQLSLGISDHAAGPEPVPLLERLHAMSSQLRFP
jgi:hypothetical protein